LCIVLAKKPNEALKNRREKKEEEGRRSKKKEGRRMKSKNRHV